MTDTDWKREAELGTLEPGKWAQVMSADLDSIRAHSLAQLKELAGLREQLTETQSRENNLKCEVALLSEQLEGLEGRIAERQRAHARELSVCRESGSAQLREMEAEQQRLLEYGQRLEDQLIESQREKDKLLTSSADIGESNERACQVVHLQCLM